MQKNLSVARGETATGAGRNSAVGQEIRALRHAQSLTVAQLAQKAGVSSGMVSQIERGLTNPSIRILNALGDALGVSLSTLLESPDVPELKASPSEALPPGPGDASIVRRLNDRPNFFVGSAPFYKELLSPSGHSRLQMMTIAMPPNSRSEDILVAPGEKAGFVMSGEMTLTVGADEYRLGAGDSFQFDGSIPHDIFNRTSETTKVFWIISLRDTPSI